MAVKYIHCSGEQVKPYIQDLAHLRVEVFREFPYLYDGNFEYEKKYLDTYLNSSNSLVILALANNTVIGATTCLPLVDETEVFKQVFLEKGLDINKIFYFGESVILKEFRGRGIGSQFFQFREDHAKKTIPGLKLTAFCAVDRPPDHPLRPQGYRPLVHFWKKLGYSEKPHMKVWLPWKDIDKITEDKKSLTFWLKSWPQSNQL